MHISKWQNIVLIIVYVPQESILYIYKNTEDLPSGRICGIIFEGNGCSRDEPSLEWTIDIDLGSKPEANRIDNKKADVKVSTHVILLHEDFWHNKTSHS
jgi:hypothetical protein